MSPATVSAATRPTPLGTPAAPAEIELAAVMDRASGARLAAAERLVRVLPAVLGDGLQALELCLSAEGTFTALARLSGGSSSVRRRLAFWCARAGARDLFPQELPAEELAAFKTALIRCPRQALAEPGAVAAESRRFFTAAGLPEGRAEEGGLPLLSLEVGNPEWRVVRWDPGPRHLFVPGALAPIEGDELALALRLARASNIRTRARVVSVCPADRAGPGHPAGFTLELEEPSTELLLVLDQEAEGGEASFEKRRAHPRFTVRAPALVAARGSGSSGDDLVELVGQDGLPRFLLENLSLGGAFVRTAEPFPKGAEVELVSTLPTGDTLRLDAEVVFASDRGMGLRWDLDGEEQRDLAAVVARIAARPRRVLVVDDDAVARQMLSDALQDRGFDVICAEDGVAGLQVLSEELLSLDLLVTDLWMPRMDGEVLVRTIRRAGGESDLAIVVVSASVEAGLEKKLEREGADAVLEKELGALFMAQAAAAVLERKRAAKSS